MIMTIAKLHCRLTMYQALYPTLNLHYNCVKQILHDCNTVLVSESQIRKELEILGKPGSQNAKQQRLTLGLCPYPMTVKCSTGPYCRGDHVGSKWKMQSHKPFLEGWVVEY